MYRNGAVIYAGPLFIAKFGKLNDRKRDIGKMKSI